MAQASITRTKSLQGQGAREEEEQKEGRAPLASFGLDKSHQEIIAHARLRTANVEEKTPQRYQYSLSLSLSWTCHPPPLASRQGGVMG